MLEPGQLYRIEFDCTEYYEYENNSFSLQHLFSGDIIMCLKKLGDELFYKCLYDKKIIYIPIKENYGSTFQFHTNNKSFCFQKIMLQ